MSFGNLNINSINISLPRVVMYFPDHILTWISHNFDSNTFMSIIKFIENDVMYFEIRLGKIFGIPVNLIYHYENNNFIIKEYNEKFTLKFDYCHYKIRIEVDIYLYESFPDRDVLLKNLDDLMMFLNRKNKINKICS